MEKYCAYENFEKKLAGAELWRDSIATDRWLWRGIGGSKAHGMGRTHHTGRGLQAMVWCMVSG